MSYPYFTLNFDIFFFIAEIKGHINMDSMRWNYLLGLVLGVLTPLFGTASRLFRGGKFLLVRKAGMPGENHRSMIGK